MPNDEYANDPKMRTTVHAAAKRGQAAMFVQRNAKNCEAKRRKWRGERGVNGCFIFFLTFLFVRGPLGFSFLGPE